MRERISEKREGLSRQVSTYRYKTLRLSTGSEQVVILVHGASGKEWHLWIAQKRLLIKQKG